ETRLARLRLAALGRPPLGQPFLQATVEDRDVPRTEVAEHEPAARGVAGRRIVIDDDAVIPADAELLHGSSEIFRGRHNTWRRVFAVSDFVDVEKACAGDMALEIFVTSVAARRRHEPARVDNDEAELAETRREPFG